MAQQYKIAVIGMSGQGKSTFLNAMSGCDPDDDEPFAVAATGCACTQRVAHKTFTLNSANGTPMQICLVDTMGFPDPDPDKALEYYDHVVAACKQPLNAIVWVHKANREDFKTIETLQSLMREFNRAVPPIYLVLNGCENFEMLGPKKRAEKKKEILDAHRTIAEDLVKLSGIQVAHKLVGATVKDLHGCIKHEMAVLLAGTTQRASSMKTHKELGAELAACTTDVQRKALEVKKVDEAKAKAEDNVRSLQGRMESLDSIADAAVIAAPLLACVPAFGVFAAGGAAAAATATKLTAKSMRQQVIDAMKHAGEQVNLLRSLQGDQSTMASRVAQAKRSYERVDGLFQALKRARTR